MATTYETQDQIRPLTEPPVPRTRTRRRYRLLLGIVVALIAATAALLIIRDRDESPVAGVAADAAQSVEGGNVTVTVTWGGIAAGPVFTVTLDTHSVDLDGIDITTIATLRVDDVEVKPLGWDAPKGGHHREGSLTFPTNAADGSPLIDAETTVVKLVILDVAGVAERVYGWNP